MLGVLTGGILPLPTAAQQVLVQEDQLFESLAGDGIKVAEIVNGPFSYRSAETVSDTELAPFLPFLLAVLAHDQMIEGAYTAETPLYELLPDLFESDPFTVPIRVMHLLTESAGFGVPLVKRDGYRGPLKPLLNRQRTPGRMAHRDRVGQAILVRLIEETAGANLAELIYNRFLQPAGIGRDELFVDQTTLPTGQIAYGARKQILYLMIHPEQLFPPGQAVSRRQLFDTPLLEPFPGGAYHTLGLPFIPTGRSTLIALAEANSCIIAHAGASIAIWLDGPTVCSPTLPNSILALARDSIIDRSAARRKESLAALSREGGYPVRFSGHYLEDTLPHRDFKVRFNRLIDNGWRVSTLRDGTLRLINDEETRLFTPDAPYSYLDSLGNRLTFSTYRRGGFMAYNGAIYRDGGLLAEKRYVVWPVPFMLALLFSAAFYWRSETAPDWRRMARLGPLASVFITIGLSLEYYAFETVMSSLESATAGWVIFSWRLLFNAGLAFAVAVSILSLVLSRKGVMPSGPALLVAAPHLILLAFSGVGIFIIMTAWGLAGELWPLP